MIGFKSPFLYQFAYCNNDPIIGYDPNGNFSLKKLWGKAKAVVKKVVNKVVDYLLEKADLKFDYGFGFIENQIRTGGIDKIWDLKYDNGVGTVTMWSPLNLFGIDSTINLSFGLNSKNGLHFGIGHSMETANGVMTTTWGHRIVPFAFATAAIKTYDYIKDKVSNVDWGRIGERVAQVLAVVAIAAIVVGIAIIAPGLIPVLLKFGVVSAASIIMYLGL